MKLSKLYIFLITSLFLSYAILGVNMNDFGDVPSSYHAYMLTTATLAFLANSFHVYLLSRRKAESRGIKLSIFIYYFLQLFFIPLVRTKNKNLVRILLLICCLPIAYLFMIAKENEKIYALITLLHVFINDFVLYGYLH